MKAKTLLLFPNLLGEQRYPELFLPAAIFKAVPSITGLFAESEGGGRGFLKRFISKEHLLPIALLNKHTPDKDLDFLLQPLVEGERWGLVSDAGLPCIADPGYKLVRRARQLGITVQAFTGPSAITLALMLSGLPGQSFSFHGYLPKEAAKRAQAITTLEQNARSATQIFIEAPHRNRETLEDIVKFLHPATWLCVAWDLTLPTQGVISQPVEHWKRSVLPHIHKRAATYLISAVGSLSASSAAKGGRNGG